MFRSLSSVNYRIWFAGALVSNVGTWMQRTAQDWIVLTELTDHDAAAVGIVMALQLGPQLLLVSARDDDVGAGLDEPARHRLAQPLAAARDQRDLAREIEDVESHGEVLSRSGSPSRTGRFPDGLGYSDELRHA